TARRRRCGSRTTCATGWRPGSGRATSGGHTAWLIGWRPVRSGSTSTGSTRRRRRSADTRRAAPATTWGWSRSASTWRPRTFTSTSELTPSTGTGPKGGRRHGWSTGADRDARAGGRDRSGRRDGEGGQRRDPGPRVDRRRLRDRCRAWRRGRSQGGDRCRGDGGQEDRRTGVAAPDPAAARGRDEGAAGGGGTGRGEALEDAGDPHPLRRRGDRGRAAGGRRAARVRLHPLHPAVRVDDGARQVRRRGDDRHGAVLRRAGERQDRRCRGRHRLLPGAADAVPVLRGDAAVRRGQLCGTGAEQPGGAGAVRAQDPRVGIAAGADGAGLMAYVSAAMLGEELREFTCDGWIGEPPDVAALRRFTLPPMGNLPCVLYCNFDL